MRTSLAVWADWRLILIGVVMLGMAFGEGSANDWIALAVVDGHGQSNSIGAVVFGFFVAAMTARPRRRRPDRRPRSDASPPSASPPAWAPSAWCCSSSAARCGSWSIGTVLWGFGVSLGFPLGMSAAADGAANPAARVSAVAIIGYCAFLAGPPLIGFLGQHFGLLNALFLVLVLLVASFLAAPSVRPVAARRAERESAPEAA